MSKDLACSTAASAPNVSASFWLERCRFFALMTAIVLTLFSSGKLLYNARKNPASVPFFAYTRDYALTIRRPSDWGTALTTATLLLLNSGNRKLSVLTDWSGKELFRWQGLQDADQLWFDTLPSASGGLYAMVWGKYLEKIRADGSREWDLPGAFVHRLALHPSRGVTGVQNDINTTLHLRGKNLALIDDYLVFPELPEHPAQSSSTAATRISMLQFMLPSVEPRKVAALQARLASNTLSLKQMAEASLLELNTLKVIAQEIHEFARSGDLLLYFSQISTVAAFDPVAMQMRNVRRLVLEPHEKIADILVLPSGDLIYLLKNFRTRQMRVEQISLSDKTVRWQTTLNDEHGALFSETRGRIDLTPSGQLWITISDLGQGILIDNDQRTYASIRHEAAHGQFPGVSHFRQIERRWFTEEFRGQLALD
jgi:hypothetical protein